MRNSAKKLLTLLVLPVLLFLILTQGSFSVRADQLQDLRRKIEQYQKEIERLNSKANTLKNQIAQFDAQIRLAQLKIAETQEKIKLLGGRIDQLEVSLSALTNAFSTRAVETYKMARLGDPFIFIISAPDLSEAVIRFHYLQRIQEADRDLLVRLQDAQDTYEEEKGEQEKLQRQLEQQKARLDGQKAAKAYLLQVTKNDEKKYQQLLAQARAEYEAIQAIIAGKGEEIKVGHVNEGERIASIIQGASCNSSGSHIHFVVRKNGAVDNPFNYLRGGISYEDNSGGDPFNPSGSWNWPINPTIRFSQGYGETWAVKNTWVGKIYRFHNGIDINSLSSSEVKAVKSGILYRGSYNVGCVLRYVRVDHDGSDIDTLYLHVNY
jgi:murein DD-endopeptidase MepM/ murein hydrolase activator NlpD